MIAFLSQLGASASPDLLYWLTGTIGGTIFAVMGFVFAALVIVFAVLSPGNYFLSPDNLQIFLAAEAEFGRRATDLQPGDAILVGNPSAGTRA